MAISMDFEQDLRKGLGRAILYSKNHDMSGHRQAILEACLRCLSIDPQFEGTRASYTFELISGLPDRDYYTGQVLEALEFAKDDWDAVHLFRMALWDADGGNAKAKARMYECFRPWPKFGAHIGINFLELDSFQGLLFVAETIGAAIDSAEPGRFELGMLMSVGAELLGQNAIWDSLRVAGQSSACIQRFLLEAQRQTARNNLRTNFSGLSYRQAIAELPRRKLSFWGRKASEQEILQAAQGLISAVDPEQQLAHLNIFGRRAFPLDALAVLRLASSHDASIQWAALTALCNLADNRLRDVAFELVASNSPQRMFAIGLLLNNYVAGDHLIILEWFEKEEDPETLDRFANDFLFINDRWAHESSLLKILDQLYERCPNSFTRFCVVRRLLEQGALSDQRRAECALDSNDEIRQLVQDS